MTTLVSAAVALVSILLGYAVSKPIAEKYNMPLEFASDTFQRNLWFGVVYVVMVALIGLSLGTLLRNSAGGIVVLAAIFFVLPIATNILQGFVDWVADAVRFLPDRAASALMRLPAARTCSKPGSPAWWSRHGSSSRWRPPRWCFSAAISRFGASTG